MGLVPWSVLRSALEELALEFELDVTVVSDEEGVEAAWVGGELVEGPAGEDLPWPGVRLNEDGLYLMSEDADSWQVLWNWAVATYPEQPPANRASALLCEYGPPPTFPTPPVSAPRVALAAGEDF